ncbi:flagellar protein FlgN [Nocardioides sp.]|uniref:flagellar protein FlgN n=1 Tax=Nocardioides sp. TaxID=35761 RepID=UPI002736AEAF|nr:flagellar protein FlgN [Nocardioides sp.]MDP3894537.1 flagellar protein FlgN [Nocardioides sp.]
MENLSLILWRERELLETLLFKLEQEQLVLASGRNRWLMRAAREVEAVLDTLRETEVLRSLAADEAAASVGMESNPSLRALAEAVDEPWRSILLDHRDAFLAVNREVMELADSNRDLITAGYRSAREALMALDEGAETYAPDGTAVAQPPRQRLIDRSL